jgi:hypothetical protein
MPYKWESVWKEAVFCSHNINFNNGACQMYLRKASKISILTLFGSIFEKVVARKCIRSATAIISETV